MATIGEIISQLRADKNMRVDDLTRGADISEATYNRILNGESVIKLPVLFALFVQLRVHFSDIAPQLDEADMPFISAWHEVQDLVPQVMQRTVPASAIAQKISAFNQAYQTSGNVGFHQLAEELHLLQAQIAHDMPMSRSIATQLFTELAQYDRWTHFELTLLAAIMPFVPFTMAKTALTRLKSFNDPAIVGKYTDFADLLDTILIGILFNALHTQNQANIQRVTASFQRRIVPDNSVLFRALKREAHAIDAFLAGHADTAKKEYTTTLAAVQFLVGEKDNNSLTIMQALWDDATAISA